MIRVETKDGRIIVECGEATGFELVDEVSAVMVAAVMAIADEAKDEELKIKMARDCFKDVVWKASNVILKRHGIDVLGKYEVDEDD